MIDIDLAGVVPPELSGLLTDALIDSVLDDLASAARQKWIRLAQQQLKSSKRDYINGIMPVQAGDGQSRIIALVGWLANAVEAGMSPIDLRDTLLRNSRSGTAGGVKISAAGHRYRSVPFRHGTPGSSGQAGAPMGSRMGPQGAQSLAFASSGVVGAGRAKTLGQAIHKAAKGLQGRDRLAAGMAPKLAPWHSTDIYAGMQRTPKHYRAVTSSQYTTFRTISENVETGWIHPGIEGRHLVEQVEAHIGALVAPAIRSALQSALKGR